MNQAATVDYEKIYDQYWDSKDRVGERSGDIKYLSELIAMTCGIGSVLDVGCGEGFLVSELLNKGNNALGLDVSNLVVDRANSRWPDRFFHGSVLALPFPDESFNTVVSTDCLEHLSTIDVMDALREIYRVSSRYAFFQIATTQDRDEHWHLTVEGREWWESKCFEAGFRKHALYYVANPYESLNSDNWQILILLEKVPGSAIAEYDLWVLGEKRLLHTDMLRESGRRSDAHCIRYKRAAEYIRPGDSVLDVACGLGYGSYILYHNSTAKSVLGVDLSAFGIAYANSHYGLTDAIKYVMGDAQALDCIPDNSVDFITGFETIEHVQDPIAYLKELKRVLKPSGRMMICAPNDWTDESGKDPNPHHLHVYTWRRLIKECESFFLLEKVFVQTAGGAMKCHHLQRSWREVNIDSEPHGEAEWVLLLCMANPIEGRGIQYLESSWKLPEDSSFNVSAYARDYENPWLVKGIVAIGMRNQSPKVLENLQRDVMSSAPKDSVDYGAALCGYIYGLLHRSLLDHKEYVTLINEIRRYSAIATPSPHQLRWQVSLLFVGGEIARRSGLEEDAKMFYNQCANLDAALFSPLLGSKILDSLHWLAIMAVGRHKKNEAKLYLARCLSEAKRLVCGSWVNVIGDPDEPLTFGLAELTQLIDRASRAAYMLSVIDTSDAKEGLFYQESKGFFERQIVEKDFKLTEMYKAIDNLSSELRKSESICIDLAAEVVKQDTHAQTLALEVAEQDAHAQALAIEVAKQDVHAQALAIEVAKQDAHAQALALEVARQDAHAQTLAFELISQQEQLKLAQMEVAKLSNMITKNADLVMLIKPWRWFALLKKLIRRVAP